MPDAPADVRPTRYVSEGFIPAMYNETWADTPTFVVPGTCRTIEATAQTVVQSAYSTTQTRTFVLPNGIPATLVSDSTAPLASAAVHVATGSFSDPAEFQGLAHFLEHMLFMGSQRYPGETYYHDMVRNNAGSANAWTGPDGTNYHFAVLPDAFAAVLDVLGGVFEGPLLAESAISREVQAVQSEYDLNLGKPYRRLSQLQRSVSAPNTPWNGFSVGTLETLNKTGVRDALLALYARSYTTDNIAIAVTAPLPLDALQDAVLAAFGAIPRSTATRPQWVADPASMPQPYSGVYNGRVYTGLPVSEQASLSVYWQVPYSTERTTVTDVTAVVRFLLEQGAEGGLEAELRRAGWAMEVECDVERYSWFSLVGVVVSLTTEGEGQADAVVATIYAYLDAVAVGLAATPTLLEDVFARVRDAAFAVWTLAPQTRGQLSDTAYLAKTTSAIWRGDRCFNQMYYPPQLWVFDAAAERAVLALLTVENSVVYLFSEGAYTARKAAQPDAAQTEPWFQVAYVSEVVSDARRASWAPALSPLAAVLRPPPADALFSVSVPDAASDTDAPAADDVLALPAPTALPAATSGGYIDAYYRGSVFTRPVGVLRVRLLRAVPAVVVQNIRNVDDEVAAALASRGVNNALRDVRAQAAEVAMSFAVSFDLDFLEVALSGVVAQFPALLSHILNALSTPFNGTTANFDAAKRDVQSDLDAWLDSPLYQQISDMQVHLGLGPGNVVPARITALDRSVERFAAVVPEAYQSGSCQLLLSSNTKQTPRDAVYADIVAQLRTAGYCSAAVTDTLVPNLASRLLQIDQWIVVQEPRPKDNGDGNEAASEVYQLGLDSTDNEALARLCGSALHGAVFTQLRTKEALGYVVWAGGRLRSGVWQVELLVQGAARGAAYMGARMQNFIATYATQLDSMGDDAFRAMADAVAAGLKAYPSTTVAEAAPVWAQLVTGAPDWGRRTAVIAYLESLSREAFVAWYRETFLSARRRLLSTQVCWDSSKNGWVFCGFLRWAGGRGGGILSVWRSMKRLSANTEYRHITLSSPPPGL